MRIRRKESRREIRDSPAAVEIVGKSSSIKSLLGRGGSGEVGGE